MPPKPMTRDETLLAATILGKLPVQEVKLALEEDYQEIGRIETVLEGLCAQEREVGIWGNLISRISYGPLPGIQERIAQTMERHRQAYHIGDSAMNLDLVVRGGAEAAHIALVRKPLEMLHEVGSDYNILGTVS